MADWKQLQEKDPQKMVENIKNAVHGRFQEEKPMDARQNAIGGGFNVTPSYNPDAETEAQIAEQQAANVQQAQADPAMAARMAAMNEMIRRANEQRAQQLSQVPSIAEQIRMRNQGR